jgi:methyltransferase (TIGR00027 family)
VDAARPSITAYRVAMRRAAHQVLDRPLIFEDPLALRIVGPDGASEIHGAPAQFETPIRRLMRAFLVMRSRYAEDLLGAAVARGVRQYVLLGAGLDTFAYRNPYVGVGLRVFEVDHPATQAWKRERLAAAGIPVPPVSVLAFAPVDFERSTVLAGLEAVAFDPTRPAVFAWLGVVPYLTREAVVGTLDLIAGACAPGSEVIFDYSEPPERLDPARRAVFETRARAVASFGEPFITFFDTVELVAVLRGVGFTTTDDLDVDGLNARYAADPADALRVGGIGHIMRACV